MFGKQIKLKIKDNRGQGILEIIIAMAIFSLIAASIASMILGSFSGLEQGGEYTQAEALAQEGIEAIRSIREGAWNENIYNQSAVSISSNKWIFDGEGTDETIGQFTRTITFDNVCRDINDDITTCPGSYTDVHSKKVTVTVEWAIREGISNSVEKVTYLTNWDSTDWTQTDWSGSSGQSIWSDSAKYDSDDDNIATSTVGQISLISGDTKDDAFNNAADGNLSWPFSIAANYSYDSNKIEVTDGLAQLKDMGGEIDSNTQGLWHMNDSSGDLVDSSTNGNDLTQTVGTPTYSQDGKFNTSILFNGSDIKYINDGQQTGLDITDSLTLDAWIYRTASSTAEETILGKWKETGNARSYILFVNASNKLEFSLSSNGRSNGEVTLVANSEVLLNQWVHVAGVYDGSNMYVFQNGVLENSVSYSSGIADESSFFGIGGAEGKGGSSVYFNGLIDEARVSNTARWTSGFTPAIAAYGPGYASDSPSINPTTSGSATGIDSWSSFAETATKNGGEIYYQLSNDDGATWQYWNGSSWVAVGVSDYNTAIVINTNISDFSISNEQIMFKAFLESDGTQQVQLDDVSISFTAPGAVWQFSTWDVGSGEVRPTGSHNQSDGNPGGYVNITVPQGNNDQVGGYWEQAFTTYKDNPTGLSINFDYKVVDFNDTPNVAHVRIYVDTTSGTPTIQVGSSIDVSGEGSWTSASTIDPSAAITTAGVYYLKIVFWVETPGGNPGPFTIGFDNVNIDLGNGEYPTSGSLTSSAFDMSNTSPVQVIEWNEIKPANTDTQFQVRTASDSSGAPGVWTDWYGATGSGTYFTYASGTLVSTDLNGNQWVQYQVNLTGDGDETPILQEVRVNYK